MSNAKICGFSLAGMMIAIGASGFGLLLASSVLNQTFSGAKRVESQIALDSIHKLGIQLARSQAVLNYIQEQGANVQVKACLEGRGGGAFDCQDFATPVNVLLKNPDGTLNASLNQEINTHFGLQTSTCAYLEENPTCVFFRSFQFRLICPESNRCTSGELLLRTEYVGPRNGEKTFNIPKRETAISLSTSGLLGTLKVNLACNANEIGVGVNSGTQSLECFNPDYSCQNDSYAPTACSALLTYLILPAGDDENYAIESLGFSQAENKPKPEFSFYVIKTTVLPPVCTQECSHGRLKTTTIQSCVKSDTGEFVENTLCPGIVPVTEVVDPASSCPGFELVSCGCTTCGWVSVVNTSACSASTCGTTGTITETTTWKCQDGGVDKPDSDCALSPRPANSTQTLFCAAAKCCSTAGTFLGREDIPGKLAHAEVTCSGSKPTGVKYTRRAAECCSGLAGLSDPTDKQACTKTCSWCGKSGGTDWDEWAVRCL